MTLDSTQVRLAPKGRMLTAGLEVAVPTDLTTDWPAGWDDLGYASDDGVEITPDVDLTRIPAWQSALPVKIAIEAVQLQIAFSMIQVNSSTTSIYFFGLEWELASVGVAKLSIPSSPNNDERQLGIEWEEGNFRNRFYIPRGFVTDRESITVNRTDATAFGITFEALDSEGYMGFLLSNDPGVLAILES